MSRRVSFTFFAFAFFALIAGVAFTIVPPPPTSTPLPPPEGTSVPTFVPTWTPAATWTPAWGTPTPTPDTCLSIAQSHDPSWCDCGMYPFTLDSECSFCNDWCEKCVSVTPTVTPGTPTPGPTPTPVNDYYLVHCEFDFEVSNGGDHAISCGYTSCGWNEDVRCRYFAYDVTINVNTEEIAPPDPSAPPRGTGGGVRIKRQWDHYASNLTEWYLDEGFYHYFDSRNDIGYSDDNIPGVYAWSKCEGWYGGQLCGRVHVSGWVEYYTDDFLNGTPFPTATPSPTPLATLPVTPPATATPTPVGYLPVFSVGDLTGPQDTDGYTNYCDQYSLAAMNTGLEIGVLSPTCFGWSQRQIDVPGTDEYDFVLVGFEFCFDWYTVRAYLFGYYLPIAEVASLAFGLWFFRRLFQM